MADCNQKFFNVDELILPIQMSDKKTIFSFDMGGSLCKIAYAVPSEEDNKRTKICMLTFENHDFREAAEFMKAEIIEKGRKDTEIQAIGLGIGSRTDKQTFREVVKVEAELSDEFQAFSTAFSYMLKNMKEEDYLHPYTDVQLPPRDAMGYPPLSQRLLRISEEIKSRKSIYPALLGFCGSGLGFLAVDENGEFEICGGSMKAGLFYLAMGCQLTGVKSYDELYELAEKGDATVINTTILDFQNVEDYGEHNISKMTDSMPFVFEAVPFGNIIRKKVSNPKKEDLARALLHATCEEIVTWSTVIAREFRTNTIYLAGSFLKNNELAKKYLERLPMISAYFGEPIRIRYIKFEPYMGVLGALISKLI
ncbi:uncharacterized protein LOC141902769 [Tubulanus polymorphus]|uniref:uncharacterized protein LOC141902769 n=1 Tax=Tubulanus polymorphus TaxID=672921 RepID=UPI003DA6AC61